MSEVTTDSLKRIKISIGTLIILIPVFLYGLNIINNVDDNTDDITRHDTRITTLEQTDIDSKEILLELKFNLKKFMEASGEKYISRDN